MVISNLQIIRIRCRKQFVQHLSHKKVIQGEMNECIRG